MAEHPFLYDPNRPRFHVMVAICDSNRGFGFKGKLPWPKITADYDYYREKTGTVRRQGRTVVLIYGRGTWESAPDSSKAMAWIYKIVISNTKRQDFDSRASYVARSFSEAVEHATSESMRDIVDSIWIMGGSQVYKDALDHELCDRVYLTRIFKDFDADRHLVEFESTGLFEKISEEGVDPNIQEENGTRFQFEVYEKKAGQHTVIDRTEPD